VPYKLSAVATAPGSVLSATLGQDFQVMEGESY
jgi:hypothetical protein